MAQDLFGCDMPELMKIDQNFSTCDNDMTDWDRPAHEILKDFDQVDSAKHILSLYDDFKDSACISDDEDDSEVPETVSSVEASDCLVKLKQFTLTSRQHDMLELLMKAEDMFMIHRSEVYVKQTKISDFFQLYQLDHNLKQDDQMIGYRPHNIFRQRLYKPSALNFMYRKFCQAEIKIDTMELQDVLKKVRKIASPSLAGSWDNVGLLVEPSPPHKIKTIFLTNDLTPPVLEEAIQKKSDMIISYHPPIFTGMKRLTQKQWKDRIIIKCIENRIAVYSPHTSYDCVKDGVNDWLISCFDCKEVVPVEQHEDYLTCHTHQVEFDVGSEHSQPLRDIFKAEPQVKVTECRERADGRIHMSVFCTKSTLQRVMVILQDKQDSVKNMQICELAKAPTLGYGMGRKAKLNGTISLDEAVRLVKSHLKLNHVRLAKAPDIDSVSSAAVCAGSGGSVLRNVDAGLYVTGEMSHHEVLHAIFNGTSVILCDHSNTERGYLTVIKSKLEECLNKKTEIIVTEVDSDPLKIV